VTSDRTQPMEVVNEVEALRMNCFAQK
jgi:hypothetical protein